MNDTQSNPPGGDLDTWRYLLRSVREQRRAVAAMIIAVTVLMLVYVLIMPQTFTSTVTLLPPQKENSSLGLGSLLQGASSLPMFDIGSSLGFGGRPSDIFGEILKSQSVAESLIVQHRLDKYFGVPEGRSHRHAVEPLRESSEIEINKNGLIRVSVTLGTGFFASSAEIDSVKALAANVANDYVLWLDRVPVRASFGYAEISVQPMLHDQAFRHRLAFQYLAENVAGASAEAER